MRICGLLALVILALSLAAQPVAAERLDLERCLNIAMDQSTQVGISYESLQSARTRVMASYANWLPDLTFSGYAGHSYVGPSAGVFVDAQGRPIDQLGSDYAGYSFSMNSSMTLFDWGSNLSSLQQAKQSAQASSYDLEYQRDIITALVIREYYDLVRKKRLRGVQEDDVEAKRRNLEQVEAFYRIGSRTKADFLQAKVDLGNSELQLLNAINAERLAEASLKTRLNIPLQDELEIDESLEVSPQEVDLSSEVKYMLDHRSDLLAGRQRIVAAKSALKASERSRLPSVAANFRYSWNDRAWPDNSNFFKTDYNWGAGVSVSWSAFDRFITKSNIQNAKAQHRIAEYNLQQAKLDAILDVQQIVLNLEQARERLDLAEQTLSHAEENQRLADERYRVGAGTILETIEATAALTSAQASLIEARIDVLVNRADLQRATGRKISTP